MTGDTAGGLSAEPVPLLTATRIIGLNHFQEWTITQIARGQFGLNLKSSIDGVHWKDSEQSGPFGSWQEAVRSDSTLTFVRSGQSVVFDISHSELELAQMLTCDPADKFVSWPTGNVGRIGEFQIFFLARPDIGSPAAILGDEYGELLGDVIADYLWSDNFGPSSVPEGGLLTEFAPGSAVLTPTSYNGQDGKLVYIHLTEDPSIRATGVVKWLEYMGIQAESAAKLEVEILDPNGELSELQRADWLSALTHPFCRLNFSLDSETEEVLRNLIGDAKIHEAFEHPLSKSGLILFRALTEDDILLLIYNSEVFEGKPG